MWFGHLRRHPLIPIGVLVVLSVTPQVPEPVGVPVFFAALIVAGLASERSAVWIGTMMSVMGWVYVRAVLYPFTSPDPRWQDWLVDGVLQYAVMWVSAVGLAYVGKFIKRARQNAAAR